MARDTDKVAARRERLKRWIDTRFNGSQAAFLAAALARGTPINQGELSALLASKSFGERRAANLEKQAAMPPGYLADPLHDPGTRETAAELRQAVDELQVLLSLTAKAMTATIPTAGRDLLAELEPPRANPKKGTLSYDLAKALRAELGLARKRNVP
jgi:hypothetical protein